jgi:hypothetical protein
MRAELILKPALDYNPVAELRTCVING